MQTHEFSRSSPLESYANELRTPPHKKNLAHHLKDGPASQCEWEPTSSVFLKHCFCHALLLCPLLLCFLSWFSKMAISFQTTVTSRYSLLDFRTAHAHTSVWFFLLPCQDPTPQFGMEDMPPYLCPQGLLEHVGVSSGVSLWYACSLRMEDP